MDASQAPESAQTNQQTIGRYEDTAYHSKTFAPQPPRREQGFLRRMITSGTHFSFSETTDSITIQGLDDMTPTGMAEEEKSPKPMYWNEEKLIGESLSGWSQLYVLMVGIANVCLMFMLPLLYGIFLLGLFIDKGGVVDAWSDGYADIFLGITLYATLPCLLLHLHSRLLNAGYFFVAPFLRAKRVFELNRSTGMVTLFKKNKPFFTHPFIEFDCVLMSSPTQQGFLNYSLTLIHRYQNYSVGVPISGSMGANHKVIEYHRFWNMVQRYMDISQPLPDILVLEPARQRDPTTIAYDKEHNRDPRYWRDMTDDEFAKRMKAIQTEQKNTPATGKPIDIVKGPNNNASARKKPTNKKKK
ncbi:hypothetical protein [Marinomonas posidonica]|uniref:Transmembrane protein n=1 Tax=Marinomonas posidonica (strain CECT 7376 / NCIMB 14433 / IVIA-Po-181) TaxID=491952 RepID=F6CWX1_MARPP|nr:hypothetical protein [Marinomonas posidonica]AEF55533.1 hypothetical protein Mar181_2500 [Marinomonas posidonica IVIA-Po-181]